MGAETSRCACVPCKRDGTVTEVKVEVVPVRSIVDAGFPNLCMPVHRFQELTLMEPHENVLMDLSEPSDETMVHFISHEWLGFRHPDPQGTQLRRMQDIFRKFLQGQAQALFKAEDWEPFLKGVSAGTSAAMRKVEKGIAGRSQRTPDDLVREVKTGAVWLDYHSIPQATKDATFYAAVNAIPLYVERCDYFWVCAPTATHGDLQQRRDFASWRRRGWCRLEETTNFLSTNLKSPLVVTDQAKLSMYGFFDGLQMYMGRPERSVFNGTFTCCHFDHRVKLPDGSFETIACDKDTIGPLLLQVFERFLLKPTDDHNYRRNLLFGMAQTFFAGHQGGEERWHAPPEETLEECLERIGFDSLDSVDSMGWSPIVWILSIGNIHTLREVCKTRPDLLATLPQHGFTPTLRGVSLPNERFKEFLLLHEPELRLKMVNQASKMGITPVDRAAKHGFCDNLKLLLDFKASVDSRRNDNGATPLLGAASEHYPCCCRALLERRADIHAVDSNGQTALHLAVNPFAVVGNPEPNAVVDVLNLLLQARADLQVRDKAGRTPLDAARELHLPADGMELLEEAMAAWKLEV